MFDALVLARMQFAANISFHILFPTITIALAWMLFYFRWMHIRTNKTSWLTAYKFWIKIFALSFALGVVSGITMSFQFGTNWPGFMNTVGNVAGPLLAYEVLSAFFMEATFLGIMFFGMNRVKPHWHLLSCFMVAFGTTLSAFWIMTLSAWMHTPAGHILIDGVVHVRNWWEVIFNPSMPYRLIHMLMASALTMAFLLLGIAAYQWRLGYRGEDVKITLSSALTVACIFAMAQVVSGDLLGLNTLKHQPQKIAAMEGVWETQEGAPLLLFALPDEDSRTNHFEIGIPNMASLILTHDLNGEIKGLNDFEKHPPVAPVFWSFRIMVGIGMLMLFMSFVTAYYWFRYNKLPTKFSKILVLMTFSGWIATLAGWYVTEIGRQPYLVEGILLTADAASAIASPAIATTFVTYLSLYAVLIIAYIATVFYLARKHVVQARQLKCSEQSSLSGSQKEKAIFS
ncbi:MAG: cytochrome ubiquinol oxidase subunit I [Pseudomonadota bacterium]